MVSDAGYPLISDPGSYLISLILQEGFNVTVIPGASAFLSALVASGLPCDRFYFFGFLNSKSSSRKKELETLKKEETLIFYESPHRIYESLENILSVFGERKICLAREITKKFEEYIRGNLSQVIKEIEEGIKGEIVLIVEGCQKETISLDNNFIIDEIQNIVSMGFSSKDAISQTAEKYKLKKNEVYNLFHSS